MPDISFDDGSVMIDAAVVGEGLGVEAAQVQNLMRDGAIRGVCERGVGSDEGRWRLGFFHAGRSLWIVADAQGRIVGRRMRPPGDSTGPAGTSDCPPSSGEG